MKKRDEEVEENADRSDEITAEEITVGEQIAVDGEGEKVDKHEYDLVMPGFRFHPTEEEIIEFYLRRKVEGKPFNVDLIFFLDLYRFDPWELPGIDKTQKTDMGIGTVGDKELFFYVPRDRKYRNGDRPNRVTTSGYWKATGADRVIKSELNPRRPIGLKKTLVFYSGKAPKGIRTTWIMNEYRLPHLLVQKLKKPEISLCRVYNRSEVGDRHYHYQYNSRLSTSSSRVKTKSTANSTVESSHQKIVTRQLLNIDPLAPSNTADHVPASGNYLPKEGGEEMEFEILRPTTTTVVVDDISMEYMGSEHHHQDIKNYLQKSTDRFPLPDISSPSSMLQNSSQKCLSDWIPIAVDRNVSVEYYYND